MKLKRYIKFTLLVILMGCLAFLYSFSTSRNSIKKVADLDIEFEEGDNYFLTHSIVDKLLIQNQQTVKNQPKSVLDLHELEQKVLANPYIEKARVFVTTKPRGAISPCPNQATPPRLLSAAFAAACWLLCAN